jgi:hypothetical protein
VFGGTTKRGLGVAFRLLHRARVTVKVLRGKRVVKTFAARTYTANATHRLRLASGRLARGDYRVRLTIGKTSETLISRRL